MSQTRERTPVPIPKRPDDEGIRLDVAILITATALLIIGLVMNLSASSVPSVQKTGSAFALFGRQFLWAVIGFGALLFFSRIDYHRLQGLTYIGPPIVFMLLVLTLHSGASANGASRWIAIGPLTLQPSEMAKLVVLLFGADVLSRKQNLLHDWRHLLMPFGVVVALFCGVILLQPDFGTMVIVAGTSVLLAFFAGSPVQYLGAVMGAGLVLGIPVMLSQGYRRARLFGFMHRTTDALGTGYQSMQGLVALGSGRWLGLGLGSSRQKWGFLPNAHTDFIFAIVGEETGLIGTIVVLLLFAALAVLGIRAAKRSKDSFGFLIAAGVTAWISLQVLINLGAVTGLLPITGVPLPLLSFGGTSLVCSLAGLGLVAGVARRGSVRSKPRARAS